jgi:hypothetical protein
VNLKVLLERIGRGRPTKFITLTARPNPGETAEAVNARHRPAIRRLVETLRRTKGEFEYCCVTELHRSGYPHWHLVVRCGFIPQSELSRLWEHLTGSFKVDIRAIKNAKHCANYVAKYVTKTTGTNKPPWLQRVIGFSRHFAEKRKSNRPPGYTWHLLRTPLSACFDRLDARGFSFAEVDIGWVVIPRNAAYPDDPLESLQLQPRGPPR